MKHFGDFLCNFGFVFPLGTVAVSYWETIDHAIRTGGLLIGLGIGIVTFILQMKKLLQKEK